MSQDYDDWEIPEDLDNVPDSEDPPPARYLCVIEKMEKKRRKDGQGDFINIQFKIADVLDPMLESFIGRSLFDIFNLGTKSLWKLKGIVVACRGKEAATGNRIPNMTGEQLVLDAYEDDYQGRVNMRTKGYKSAKGWIGINMDLSDVADPDEAPTNGSNQLPSSTEVEI